MLRSGTIYVPHIFLQYVPGRHAPPIVRWHACPLSAWHHPNGLQCPPPCLLPPFKDVSRSPVWRPTYLCIRARAVEEEEGSVPKRCESVHFLLSRLCRLQLALVWRPMVVPLDCYDQFFGASDHPAFHCDVVILKCWPMLICRNVGGSPRRVRSPRNYCTRATDVMACRFLAFCFIFIVCEIRMSVRL
jgi:hypothetical protein